MAAEQDFGSRPVRHLRSGAAPKIHLSLSLKLKTFSLIAGAVVLAGASQVDAALARFVQIYKNDTGDTRFHLAELEVFASSTIPDGLGFLDFTGTFATSRNDVAGTVFGSGNVFPTVGTTSALEHGGGSTAPNNVLESAGNVWSSANGLGANSQYTLDLGAMVDVTTIRAWPRNDVCCSNRWETLEVRLYADDGTGNPGAVIGAASANTGVVGPGNTPQEWNFAPVPEPGAFALLALGGLALLRRRR